jgi:hypothetical protein
VPFSFCSPSRAPTSTIFTCLGKSFISWKHRHLLQYTYSQIPNIFNDDLKSHVKRMKLFDRSILGPVWLPAKPCHATCTPATKQWNGCGRPNARHWLWRATVWLGEVWRASKQPLKIPIKWSWTPTKW